MFVSFLTENWVLSGLFAILLLAFFVNELRESKDSFLLPPAKVVLLMNHQEALILDLRGENSFSQGHIVGSLNIPIDVLPKKIAQIQKYSGKPVVLVASTENDLKKARDLLAEKDIQAVSLAGGLQAWKTAGLPLTK